MIILEGPDGAGKTTLLAQLVEDTGLPVHPRFATHDGPPDRLFSRVIEDCFTRDRRTVELYDRHSFWSEYIYGSVLPQRQVDSHFLKRPVAELLHTVAQDALVVVCLPPFDRVVDALLAPSAERQMASVVDYIGELYDAYRVQAILWPNQANVYLYDYTEEHAYPQLLSRINRHIEEITNG